MPPTYSAGFSTTVTLLMAERQHIKARQREGIAAAKARGIRFGRPKMKLPPQFLDARNSYLSNDLDLRAAAASCGLSATTFWRSCHSR